MPPRPTHTDTCMSVLLHATIILLPSRFTNPPPQLKILYETLGYLFKSYLALSTLSLDSSIRRQRRAMVVSSDMPRWLEPKGSRGIMVGITSTPV